MFSKSWCGVVEVALPRNGMSVLRRRYVTLGLVSMFTLFLIPVSVGDASVNYSYVLLPLLMFAVTGNLRRPPIFLLQLMALYVAIFLLAATYQQSLYGDYLRRIVSFAIFMSLFSYMFVRINDQMVLAFKVSIVAISFGLSVSSAYLFFASGGSAVLGFEAKDLVGSQRVGFVYLMAIWVAYLYQAPNRILSLIKFSTILIVLIGLFLTFSRSSVVALIASFIVFASTGLASWLKRPNLLGVWKSLGVIVGLGLLLYLLESLVPLTFKFFGERLFAFLQDSNAVSSDLGDVDSSGGTRIALLEAIANFVARNPLTGSGFLGVWVMPDSPAGSAHNEYADVLFRTGIPGILSFAYLLFRTARFLYIKDSGLFWGFFGVLCYGLFHETFKESQGGFILAMLFGLMSQSANEYGVRK